MTNEFAGKVAVVTGGSEGLGYDLCRTLCEAGCRVYFCALDNDLGTAAKAVFGKNSLFFPADLADPTQIELFAGEVSAREPAVDYLVNNAAIDDRIPIDETTAEQCDRMWAVNLRSLLLSTRAFLPLLRVGNGKSIVNLGTTNYMLGLEPFTLYNATKSGIVGYTRSLARELGKEGIRANMVSPGWIMTEKQLRVHVTEKDQTDLLAAQALKTLLTPAHVTPAILFLLSSAAAGITGQNLVVDGGKFML